MVIYICNKCNKNFNRKSNYIIHINRKFSCIKNIEYNDINEKVYECIYCNNEYSYKQSKYKHQLICKDKIKNENKINKLEEENQELKKLILELNNKVNKISSNKIINNTNNITNNNITNNNIIIQYGYEYKTEGLTNEEIIKIVNKGWTALCESIKLTHFNSRIPQLHNIYIPDKKFNTIMVFKDEKFELNKLENVLYDLIDKHVENIKEYLDMNLNFQDNRLPAVKQLLDKITEIYDNDNFNKFKNDDNISDILLFLYNNRELVIKNYEKYLNNMISQ